MINLFSRIYLSYDVSLSAGDSQKRIFVTDRQFPYPISDDPVHREALGILQYYQSVDAFLENAGGLQAAIQALFEMDEKVCFITTHEFATLLHMCVFKSFTKNPTLDAAYTFYRATYVHQQVSAMRTLTNYANDAMFKGAFPQMLSKESFETIYNAAEACDCLKTIRALDVPIELLMANYLAEPSLRTGIAVYFLIKYRTIALENAVFRIKVLRNEILTNSVAVSKYLGKEVDEIHAAEELIAYPPTAWLGDDTLALYSEDKAIEKYSVYQLIDIYDSIEELLQVKIEERSVLEYIAKGHIVGLVELDMQDERGNFIGTEQFVSKVNGVFINKCYQEGRKGNTDFFQPFRLIDEITVG